MQKRELGGNSIAHFAIALAIVFLRREVQSGLRNRQQAASKIER